MTTGKHAKESNKARPPDSTRTSHTAVFQSPLSRQNGRSAACGNSSCTDGLPFAQAKPLHRMQVPSCDAASREHLDTRKGQKPGKPLIPGSLIGTALWHFRLRSYSRSRLVFRSRRLAPVDRSAQSFECIDTSEHAKTPCEFTPTTTTLRRFVRIYSPDHSYFSRRLFLWSLIAPDFAACKMRQNAGPSRWLGAGQAAACLKPPRISG